MKVLSRSEMKNVLGGGNYSIDCNTASGYSQIAPGSCTGSSSWYGQQANSYCRSTAGCLSCGVNPAQP